MHRRRTIYVAAPLALLVALGLGVLTVTLMMGTGGEDASSATATPEGASGGSTPGGPSGTTAPGSPSPRPASRVTWQGHEWYLHGANLPWYNWACDFGCGSDNGVSNPANRAEIENRLAGAADAGMPNIRWWLFPGDPWQIARDGSGAPTGINPAVYADIDAALAMAEKHDLYYTFVFFSAPTHIPSAWVHDQAQRQALADVLGELAARYKDNPHILAWEIINEPEFDIWNGKIEEQPVVDTVRAIADSLNAASSTNVTVGAAMLDGLYLWKGMGLDFYQAHWYDYMDQGGWCALCTDYAAVEDKFALDAPLVLGEVYAANDVDARKRLDDFYAKGYAGAWAWSLFPERTDDHLVVDPAASQGFASAHPEIGPKAP